MKMMVILNIVRALGTVPKNMGKRLCELKFREKIETIQTTALEYFEDS